jgi:type VI secretion system protein ImpL
MVLLFMALLLIANLYIGGFYANRPDRVVWSISLSIGVLALPGMAIYLWILLAERHVTDKGQLPGRSPVQMFSSEGKQTWTSVRQHMQQHYPGKWRRIKPWVAALFAQQRPDEEPVTAFWQEIATVLYISAPHAMPDTILQRLRGRWRLPLDGVVLLDAVPPAAGSPALQQLLDFNSRSGWRLPVCLALTAQTVPAGGVSCALSDARNPASTTRDLQQLVWQLAVDGQADILQRQPDSARLALSAALDQAGVITRLAQQLADFSLQLPPGQPLVRLGWVSGEAATLPAHLALQMRNYAPRRQRLSGADKCGWGLTTLALLLMLGLTVSFLHNHQAIRQAEQHRLALQQIRSLSTALPALASVQQQIVQLEQQQHQGLPWWWRLGLNQAQVVQQALLDGYGKAARHWVVKPVQQNLRQVLLALNDLPLSNGENAAMHLAQQQGYDSLKAYLMLDMPTHAQPAFLAAQLRQADGLSGGTRAELLRFYSSQLPSQPGWRLAAEPDVVAAARQTLLSLNGIEHGEQTIYQSILAQAAAKYPPRSAASLLPGVDSRGLFAIPGTLPGVYTREAWEGYVSTAFDKADPKQGSEAAWVMAVAGNKGDAAALQNRLRQRYFTDYAAAWQTFLNHLHWQAANSLASAAEQLNAYADPQRSPLQALMALLQYQGRAGATEKSLAGDLLDKTRQLVGQTTKQDPAAKNPETEAPLSRAFGPVLALGTQAQGNAAASTVSLARYLETVTAVRLKLQQLSSSPNPDAAARQLAQSLFKGQQNELSDGQKYAALLAASLGQEWAGFAQQLFVSPLDGAGMVVMLPAAADVNALWRRSVVLPWGREMVGRFPFNATDNDASIPALSRYLAPEQGEIARFLGNTLGGALVQEGDQWLPSPTLANAAAFDADFLNAVNALSRLASRWYVQGEAAYQFELMPVAMPGLVRTELSVDGQTLSYFNQKESWSVLRWPGNSQQAGSRLVWESLKAGSRQTLEFSGRWAFIRLLEKARVEQLDKARYQLDFALPDGLSARYILRTSTGDGPLALLKLLQFKLPERVFVLPGPVASRLQVVTAN